MNAELTSRTECVHGHSVGVVIAGCSDCDSGMFRAVHHAALTVDLPDDQRSAVARMLRDQAPAVERYAPVLGAGMRSLAAQLE